MHEFDSGFFGGREPAWHGLGTVIDEDTVNVRRALKLGGLDWDVIKGPLITTPEFDGEEWEIDVPDYVTTIRADRRRVLGVVGKDYEVIQNDELLEFAAALCDTGDAIFHTAGSLKEGQVVWALARLPQAIQLLGMEDEKINPFLLVTNAHNGSRALTAALAPVRVVCANTLNLALARAVRAWSIRHTRNARDRITEAQEALGIAFNYMEAFEKTAEKLAGQKISQKAFGEFLANLIPYDEEMTKSILAGEPNRSAKNVDEARDVVRSLFVASPNLENVRGTKWAALNAVAEYVDFGKKQRTVVGEDGQPDERVMGERRFVRVVFQNTMKQRALRLLDPKLAHAKGDNLDVLAQAAQSVA